MALKEYKRITLADNCVGCLACEVACKQEHDLPVGIRWIRVFPDLREVGGRWRLNYEVTECGHTGPPPCQSACPADIPAWHYIRLISEGKFGEALEVIREITPFAGVLGYVCTRPCEVVCERGKADEPVAIRALKRFLAEYEMHKVHKGGKKAASVKKEQGAKVAIVGSGPAGLSCAYDLVRWGYAVTVFEAAPQAGGHLRYSIPDTRLPRGVLDAEIDYIRELGVEIRTNTPITDLKEVMDQGYKAIFVAAGAHRSRKLEIPGEEAKGVMYALDFLKQLHSGHRIALGEKVAVIGGGNTAVDAARAARHLGSKEVLLFYRRSRGEMPAIAEEVKEAEREGVKLEFLTAPVRILSQDGRLAGIQCVRTELGDYDASGRRSAVPIRGSEFDVHLDNLLIAIGESVDPTMLPQGLEYTRRGTILVNPQTLQTSIAGVFAGGDVVTGPRDVVGAIASGKQAAVSIDRYLKGTDLRRDRPFAAKVLYDLIKGGKKSGISSLKDEKAAVAEAGRCFDCGICFEALNSGQQPACVKACPSHCIYYRSLSELRERKWPF